MLDYRRIKDYPNYILCNNGNIWSIKRNMWMKNRLSNTGYYTITLCNKKHKRFLIHRLIGIYFIENKDNNPFIDHINRIRTDNRIENLRWVNASTNSKNRTLRGSLHKTKDKVGGKIYEYYRVVWYVNQKKNSKRFKEEIEAKKFLLSIYPEQKEI